MLILARAIVAMESEVSEGFLEWVVFELALRECDKDQQAERKFYSGVVKILKKEGFPFITRYSPMELEKGEQECVGGVGRQARMLTHE